ncbi:unnamed protein product, partial [Ascophyllum nodosum]
MLICTAFSALRRPCICTVPSITYVNLSLLGGQHRYSPDDAAGQCLCMYRTSNPSLESIILRGILLVSKNVMNIYRQLLWCMTTLVLLTFSRRSHASTVDCVSDAGGTMVNGVCWVISSDGQSCTDKCTDVGGWCDEPSLEMNPQECNNILMSHGIYIESTTQEWESNFGTSPYIPSYRWFDSGFDENTAPFMGDGQSTFRRMGCVLSPIFDATDQASGTSGFGNFYFNRKKRDEAQAHDFEIETPLCIEYSFVFRRACSCDFPTMAPTPAPTPAPTHGETPA